MLIASVVLLIAVTILFTLSIRAKDVPPPDPVSPTRHLEERRAAIYENLRDLQFEFRVGKLSDQDYQQTKLGLQKELAAVLGEIDKVAGGGPKIAARAGVAPTPMAASITASGPEIAATAKICPHCGAGFPKPMKFCGECGKAMS
jgi:hypothetical protein